jgi:hypothetical protein
MFLFQKRAPKTTFSKKFKFLDIFLVLNQVKYHKKENKFDRKVPKMEFWKFFLKQKIWSDFLEFLIFCLILGLNPAHSPLLFSSPVALVGSQSKIFKFFKKCFFAFFGTLPLQLGCFF